MKRSISALLGISALLSLKALADPPTGPTTAPTTSPIAAQSQPATLPSTQPAVETVRRGDLTTVVEAQGYFEPIDSFEFRVRTKVYGGDLTVESIVPNGSSVKAGDVLLQFGPTSIKKQIAASENDLTAARANLTKTEADSKLAEEMDALALRQQQDALKEAEAAVKWWETVDGPQMLLNSQLAVKSAQAQVDDQQDELDQLKKMYKTEELTSATADIVTKRAVRGLELSKTQLTMVQERAEKSRTFYYPAAHQKVLDALTSAKHAMQQFEIARADTAVLRQTNLVSSRTAFAAAELRFNDLKADLDKLTARAPADGVVAYGVFAGGGFQGDPKALRVGEKAQQQVVLMTVFTPGKLRVIVDLPENKFVDVKSGTAATLTPVAFPELKLQGTCDQMPRTATATQGGPVYQQTISVQGVDPRLVPGNKVAVHIDAVLAHNALLVPSTAVANSTVWVRGADGSDQPHKIVTGRSDGKLTEITDGLNVGDKVLVQAKP